MNKNKVEILDCTLRDGSYVLNYNFNQFETSLISRLLFDSGINYVEVGHGVGIGANLKNGKSFLICLVAGDKRCSLNKLKKILNERDVSMANANEVKENTGFSIGGVSPIAHIKKLDILVDKSLNRFSDVFAAAGHPNCVFKINYRELIKITNGIEKEISE